MELLTLVPIFGYALFIFVHFGLRASSAVFISVSFIVSVVSLLAMIELLKEASYAIFIIGVVLFLYLPYKFREKNIEFFSSTPIILTIIFSFIYFFISRDSHFFFWDEFSHWGLFIKEMMYTNRLYDATTLAAHPHYVPGAPVWQYFTMLFSGFSEGGAYFAHFLLIASATMMIYENTSFKKPHWIVLAFLLQIAFLANFGHGLNKIYVDHVVGAMAAGLFMMVFFDRFDKKSIFLLLAPLVAVSFIKEVGLYFSVASVGLLLIKYTFISFDRKLALCSLMLGIATIVIFSSWSIRVDIKGVQKSAQSISGIVSSILSNEKLLDEKTHKMVKERFWRIFFNQQIAKSKISENYNEFEFGIMDQYTDRFRLSTFGILLLFIALTLFIVYTRSDRGTKKESALYLSYLFLVTLIYIAIVYLSYFVAFGGNAPRIPSYIRYMNTSILPMMFVFVAFFLPLSRSRNETIETEVPIAKSEVLPLVFIAGFTLWLYTIETPNLKTLYMPNPMNDFRANTIPTLNKIASILPKNSRLLVIIPVPNNGSLRNFLRYDAYPLCLESAEIDIFQKPIPEIYKIIGKYPYLWLPFQTKEINNIYRTLFSNENIFTLYAIASNKNGLLMRPMM